MKRLALLIFLLLMLGCAAPALQPAPLPAAAVDSGGDSCRFYSLALDDPTAAQVTELLSDYDPDCVFTHRGSECMDYAFVLQQQATKRGLWCRLVLINLNVGGHVAVGFQTTDRGLIIIDAETKAELEIKEDRLFHQGREVSGVQVLHWKIYN